MALIAKEHAVKASKEIVKALENAAFRGTGEDDHNQTYPGIDGRKHRRMCPLECLCNAGVGRGEREEYEEMGQSGRRHPVLGELECTAIGAMGSFFGSKTF